MCMALPADTERTKDAQLPHYSSPCCAPAQMIYDVRKLVTNLSHERPRASEEELADTKLRSFTEDQASGWLSCSMEGLRQDRLSERKT